MSQPTPSVSRFAGNNSLVPFSPVQKTDSFRKINPQKNELMFLNSIFKRCSSDLEKQIKQYCRDGNYFLAILYREFFNRFNLTSNKIISETNDSYAEKKGKIETMRQQFLDNVAKRNLEGIKGISIQEKTAEEQDFHSILSKIPEYKKLKKRVLISNYYLQQMEFIKKIIEKLNKDGLKREQQFQLSSIEMISRCYENCILNSNHYYSLPRLISPTQNTTLRQALDALSQKNGTIIESPQKGLPKIEFKINSFSKDGPIGCKKGDYQFQNIDNERIIWGVFDGKQTEITKEANLFFNSRNLESQWKSFKEEPSQLIEDFFKFCNKINSEYHYAFGVISKTEKPVLYVGNLGSSEGAFFKKITKNGRSKIMYSPLTQRLDKTKPSLTVVQIAEEVTYFVFAEGLWNCTSKKEVAKIFEQYFKDGEKDDIAEKIVNYAVNEKGSKDNISVIVVKISNSKQQNSLPVQEMPALFELETPLLVKQKSNSYSNPPQSAFSLEPKSTSFQGSPCAFSSISSLNTQVSPLDVPKKSKPHLKEFDQRIHQCCVRGNYAQAIEFRMILDKFIFENLKNNNQHNYNDLMNRFRLAKPSGDCSEKIEELSLQLSKIKEKYSIADLVKVEEYKELLTRINISQKYLSQIESIENHVRLNANSLTLDVRFGISKNSIVPLIDSVNNLLSCYRNHIQKPGNFYSLKKLMSPNQTIENLLPIRQSAENSMIEYPNKISLLKISYTLDTSQNMGSIQQQGDLIFKDIGKEKVFCCVFDGNQQADVASKMRSFFQKDELKENWEHCKAPHEIVTDFVDHIAFKLFGMRDNDSNFHYVCCASSTKDSILYFANLGNCQGMLFRKTSNSKGDEFRYIPLVPQNIEKKPKLTSILIPNGEFYLVLATDGLWNYMSPEEMTKIFEDCKFDKKEGIAQVIAEYAVNIKGSKDNTSVVVMTISNPNS